ncbi:MAG: patatin-like phospholipase family protein, partial [Vicinamibacteria bacterium]
LVSRVLLPYSDVSNFDDLPIPFRCVATDLENGDVVVFDHGPIAPAVRASMSIPGTFDPVRLNGRLIADGGILNNIPVDIAEKMGSDVVIAVRTGPKADERPEETIGGVAKRAITLMMQSLEKPKLREADVVIVPNLDGLTGGDFDKADEFAERGYAAAELQKDALMRYALGDADWAAYRASIDARKKPRTDAISFVEVTGVAERAATEITQQLSRHIGKKQDIPSIEDDLNRMIGLGRYASATYTKVLDDNGMGLGVSVRDKSYGPPFVRFGLQTNNENEDINLAVGARVTLMDITGVGSEWRFDGTLGSTLAFTTEWYQPLAGARPIHGGAFLSPHAGYSRTTESLYSDHDLAAIYGQQRVAAGMDLGWNSGGNTRFRIGYEAAHVRNVIRVGEPVLPATTGGEQSLRARFDSDGQNAAYLASHGVRFSSNARWFLKAPDARKEFGLVEASFLAATTAGRANILSVSMEGGFSLSTTPPLLYQFSLGGPFRLGGFPTYAFRGPKYFLGGLGLKAPIGRLPPLLGGRVYLGSLVEAGSVFTDPTNARVKTSFTTGVAADTFLGPFFAGGSVGSDGNVRVYFLIGRIVR